jgi:hypothetical protein
MELENFEYGVVKSYDQFRNCGTIDRDHGRGELFFYATGHAAYRANVSSCGRPREVLCCSM